MNNPPRKRINTCDNNVEINPEGKKAFIMSKRRDTRLNLSILFLISPKVDYV